jgi:S-adenosylmethionine hydrolase
MKRKPLISLLSDFGLKDPYVAEMKAVILSICPNASIVDISHEINKYDMRMGAYVLARAAPYFPEETIYVAVVDPGVGTTRRPIIVEAEHSFYIGPDNGLLMLSARKEGISHVYEITNPKYMLKTVSRTFHGRDVFSPAAAHLANGVHVSDFGPIISDPVVPSFAHPTIREGEIAGEVIHIDGFGNVITNITDKEIRTMGTEVGKQMIVESKNKKITLRLCSAYGEVLSNIPLIIVGSDGFLEVAANQGDASRIFKVKTGDKVILRLPHQQ